LVAVDRKPRNKKGGNSMKKLMCVTLVTILVIAVIPLHAQQEVLLKIGCQDEPKTLNVWKATDVWSTHVLYWFYPSFYYRKPVTMEPLPDLCTISFDELKANSPDGLTFTFPLRDDVSWDDGTPVTAQDFVFAYDLIMELEIPDYIPQFEHVEYMKAVDDYTVEIKLAKCTPQFEEAIIYHFPIPIQQFQPMLEEARNTEVPLQTFLDMDIEDPISCGPFSFGQWEKGAFVKLVANPDYHGKGRTVNVEGVGTITEGPDYDGIILKLYGTTDAALLGIQKGEIDYIWWNLDPGYIAQVLGNSDITIEKADTLQFYYLAPNTAKEPFDDLVLRQALAYLVQKDFIVSRVLQGYGGEAHSVVMPAAGDWYNPNVNTFGHGMSKEERMAAATEILTAAGYTVPDAKYPAGVVLLPDGSEMQPFEILTPPADYDPMRAMSGVLIQEWWRELGIPVTAKPTSFGEIVHQTFESMTFDWFILGWRISGSGYPDSPRYFFHSDQAVPDGNNPMSYKNPEMDAALEDLMGLCDREELLEASYKVQELAVEEVAYCPLYYRTLNEAHRNDTFEGWFTQLGGISGTESPQHCILYLKPITEKPAETPEPTETEAPSGGDGGGTCLGTLVLTALLLAGIGILIKKRQ
jgi:ABC-type transport system substrate-binding protein